MSLSDGLGADMGRFDLDADTAERMLRGTLTSEDAPPAYRDVAGLFGQVVRPTGRPLPGEQAGVAAVIAAVHGEPSPAPVASRRKSVITKAKLAAAGLTGALTLTTGLAAANALPGAAQQVASDALAKVGVSVPGPNDHAGNHPNTRGKSADHQTQSNDANGNSSDNKGSEISNLAHTTDATGVDKGAAISTDASGGKSQAGQHGASTSPPASTPDSGAAPVATPNSGGTSTADTASDGHSSTGTGTADQQSGGAASSGSGNATTHRP